MGVVRPENAAWSKGSPHLRRLICSTRYSIQVTNNKSSHRRFHNGLGVLKYQLNTFYLLKNLTPDYFNHNVIDKLAGLLALKVTKVDKGSIELELQVEKKHLAINDYLHAGTVVTLADTAAGNVCLANLPDNATGFTTIELKCNLTGTVRSGKIKCTAECLHEGKTTQVWESKIMAETTHKMIAKFICTQLILYPKQ